MGPRLIAANISGQESFIVTVTMALIKPSSASSVIANKSRCCRFHHSVLSGISDGCAVPNNLTTGSGSLEAEAPFRPTSWRFLFLKNNSVWINLLRDQNPHNAERRNHDSINISLLRENRCVPPDPTSANKLPVPYGCTHGNTRAS